MSNMETDKRTFMDLFREEIKECVSDVISKMVPAKVVTESLPLTMTVPQLCKQMNISRPMAYEMINSEGFPAFKVGTKYLINSQGLQQWINKQSNWGG